MSTSPADSGPAGTAPSRGATLVPPASAPAGAADAARADREKHNVALSSVIAAVVLTGTKLAVGLSTGSLGILSEAMHSGLDLVAAGLTLVAVRVSGKPADPDHPYGHGKVENLSALLQTVLLLLTCAWITYEAARRLILHHHEVDANLWAFLVVLLSLAVDWSRSRALLRVARRHHSAALEADALHFSTDLWSSLVVLGGLLLVRLGQATGAPWLVHADPVAALVVAGIVIKIGWQLGRHNVDALLDRTPPQLRERLARAACVAGVRAVPRLRVRQVGPESFVDLTVHVDRGALLDRAHGIADEVERSIHAILPRADVVVHVEPVEGADEGILDKIRILAAREGFSAHAIQLHEIGGRYTIALHLEATEGLTVGQAHERAHAFEEAVRAAVSRLDRVLLHLEPEGTGARTRPGTPAEADRIQSALRLIPAELGVACEPHALDVRVEDRHLLVSFHCVMPPSLPLEEAHRVSHEIERRLRARLPEIGRVTVRVEPPQSCPESYAPRTTPRPPR